MKEANVRSHDPRLSDEQFWIGIHPIDPFGAKLRNSGLSDLSIAMWFGVDARGEDRASFSKLHDGKTVITVRKMFYRDWMIDHFLHYLQKAFPEGFSIMLR